MTSRFGDRVSSSVLTDDRRVLLLGLVVSATLTGYLLVEFLPEPDDFPSWQTLLVLALSTSYAAVAVRIGGGLSASIVAGHAIGVFETYRFWSESIYGGEFVYDAAELVWYSWRASRLLVITASTGFVVGAVWTYRGELRANANWILTRVSIALLLVLLITGGWHLTGGPHPAEFL